MTHRQVIIIGAGWSGIYALKHCLEEGLDAIILEKHSYPLGNWHYTKKPGGVLRGTHAITSLIYMQPSDFPFPDDTPDFPHHDLVEEHMLNYIKHFKLEEYIHYNVTVKEVTKNDYWEISTNKKDYDTQNLIIATGQTTIPNIPTEKVYEKFKGEKIHSSQFSESLLEKYKGKNVLVVGGGIESCDMACLFAQNSRVGLSIRNGQWFQPLILGAYEPADAFYSRFIHSIPPLYYTAKYFIGWVVEVIFGKGGSGVKEWSPKSRYFNGFYNKNRDVLRLVSKGDVAAHGDIKSISDSTVEFADGSSFEADVIVFGTGYNTDKSLDFMEKKYHAKYKLVFSVADTTLAYVGFARPYVGSIPFLSEIQARVVASKFAHKLVLPEEKTLREISKEDRLKQLKMFPRDAKTNWSIVNLFDYTDELGKLIDAKPKKTLVLTNPILWWKIMRQVHTPFALRINDEDTKKRELAIKEIGIYNRHPVVKSINSLVTVVVLVELVVVATIMFILYLIVFG